MAEERNGINGSTQLAHDNFKDMADRLAYSLHFHSISHYISADRYRNLHRWLTYLSIIMATVCVLNAGSILNDYMNSAQRTTTTLSVMAAVCSVALSAIVFLDNSEFSSKSLHERHKKAGSKLKELEQKVDVWGCTAAINPDISTEELRAQYNAFLRDMAERKEGQISSEDWTFPIVHQQLGKKWKAIKEKDSIMKKNE